MATYKKKNNTLSNLAGYLERYWIVILGCILVLPMIYNYLKNFLQTQADSQADKIAEDPVLLKDSMDDIWDAGNYQTFVQRDELQYYAKIIYDSFHIPTKWYHWVFPNYWVEDDETAYKAILASFGGIFDSDSYDYVALCYASISGSAKRDLAKDINKYLDKKYTKNFYF